MIRVRFKVGTIKLKDDTDRLERAVDGMRTGAREGLRRCREFEAAARRFRQRILRAAEDAFLRG